MGKLAKKSWNFHLNPTPRRASHGWASDAEFDSQDAFNTGAFGNTPAEKSGGDRCLSAY